MFDYASSNNPEKNVSNINPPDEDPNTNIWGEDPLKSLTDCKTADPHHQGTDGEGPLMCDYPDTDEDSLTTSPESLQKNTFNDRYREGQAHKQNCLSTFYDDDDSVSSDDLERSDNENIAGRAGTDQNLLKENKPVEEMSKLADKDVDKDIKEEKEIDGLLDPKTPEGGDWEPTEECMRRSLEIASKKLREWKRSRKIKKGT
ncbi:uncharacterized protein LAJ45_03301 [Morchella importuna]|uniref:uncharacterized protein n=1 Tax=Morchella importuna TaxID=1174673 RepID=UPI001E8DCF4C|nr:uncharacterized protein LAJ45_03301 [Morchella importuna]KAH8152461.1 hypothetical protein LAJ45_03301 [Morchella importuna]